MDPMVEALLREAADDAPVPSAALLARIAGDAAAVQATFQPPAAQSQKARSGWQFWLGEIGGLPALGGLAVSTCLGLYLGLANPQLPMSVQDFAGLELGLTSIGEAEDVFSTPMLGDLDWIDEG